MKTALVATTVLMLTALAGCSSESPKQGIYTKNGNTLNVNNERAELYQEGNNQSLTKVSNNYGYVRHQKSPIMNDTNQQYAAIDREQLANIISRLSTAIPNVHDVATLVTDQEVLISYMTDTKDRNQTADQVKKTAMSVIPRYYHVYVTDNKNLMRDIENLSYLNSTSKNARTNVKQLITRMKKSPQGLPMSSVENENGETAEDRVQRPMQ